MKRTNQAGQLGQIPEQVRRWDGEAELARLANHIETETEKLAVTIAKLCQEAIVGEQPGEPHLGGRPLHRRRSRGEDSSKGFEPSPETSLGLVDNALGRARAVIMAARRGRRDRCGRSVLTVHFLSRSEVLVGHGRLDPTGVDVVDEDPRNWRSRTLPTITRILDESQDEANRTSPTTARGFGAQDNPSIVSSEILGGSTSQPGTLMPMPARCDRMLWTYWWFVASWAVSSSIR